MIHLAIPLQNRTQTLFITKGYLSSKLGRKSAMLICCAPFFGGWLLVAFAENVWYIFVGRFCIGLASGIICTATPAYLIEISTPQKRGLLGSSFQLFIVIGVLMANILGSFISWKWHATTSVIFVVLSFIIMSLMPESPRWLIANGLHEKAIVSIKFLWGPNIDAESESASIREDLLFQAQGKIKCKELLQPGAYKPMLISIGLLFFQQFSGFNAIMFYAVKVMKDADSPLEPTTSVMMASALLVLVTAISTFLMDKAGRRVLLLASSGGMTICLFILGSIEYMKLSTPWLTESYSWVPLLCIYSYIAAFSLGFCPVPWLMIPEISPLRLRSFIGGMSASICWTFFFIVTKTFEDMKSTLHDYGTYFLYGVFCILAFLFSLLCVKETKGKRFEEIQEMFSPRVVDVNAEEEKL